MHLAAKHFVEGVSLTSMNSLLKKDIKAGMDADANNDEEEYDVADIIGKGLALVTQV